MTKRTILLSAAMVLLVALVVAYRVGGEMVLGELERMSFAALALCLPTVIPLAAYSLRERLLRP